MNTEGSPYEAMPELILKDIETMAAVEDMRSLYKEIEDKKIDLRAIVADTPSRLPVAISEDLQVDGIRKKDAILFDELYDIGSPHQESTIGKIPLSQYDFMEMMRSLQKNFESEDEWLHDKAKEKLREIRDYLHRVLTMQEQIQRAKQRESTFFSAKPERKKRFTPKEQMVIHDVEALYDEGEGSILAALAAKAGKSPRSLRADVKKLIQKAEDPDASVYDRETRSVVDAIQSLSNNRFFERVENSSEGIIDYLEDSELFEQLLEEIDADIVDPNTHGYEEMSAVQKRTERAIKKGAKKIVDNLASKLQDIVEEKLVREVLERAEKETFDQEEKDVDASDNTELLNYLVQEIEDLATITIGDGTIGLDDTEKSMLKARLRTLIREKLLDDNRSAMVPEDITVVEQQLVDILQRSEYIRRRIGRKKADRERKLNVARASNEIHSWEDIAKRTTYDFHQLVKKLFKHFSE